ncbi:hypothetical protein Avbf_06130 [Armadillidium vulgare]|nr:hypothetical protein Avbf_06130 [Armadillidium vulgare]
MEISIPILQVTSTLIDVSIFPSSLSLSTTSGSAVKTYAPRNNKQCSKKEVNKLSEESTTSFTAQITLDEHYKF